MSVRLLIYFSLSVYEQDIKIKGLLVITILFVYFLISLRREPYFDQRINQIDRLSTVVLFLSITICLFLYDNQYEFWQYISYIFLVMINAYFIFNMILRIIG